MPIHIDEMVSDVTVEPGSPSARAPHPVKWEEMAHVREAQAQLERDRFRSAAEGFDD